MNQKPQFTTRLKGNEIPQHPDLPKLMQYCRQFYDRGLAPDSLGNMSFRRISTSDDCIITASHLDLGGDLKPEDFYTVTGCDLLELTVDAIGKENGRPSSEAMLHHSIYHARKDINAIFHGHSPILLQSGPGLGIPETEREVPYGSPELVDLVLRIAAQEGVRFLNAKGHGFFSLGRSMKEAADLAFGYLDKT